MSIYEVITNVKDNAVDNLVCPLIHKLGIHAIPAVSILIGEITLSYILQHGIILPSPIGVELMEFPAKMVYILKRNSWISFLPKDKPLI